MIKREVAICYQCKHQWLPRESNPKPIWCPKCGSVHWHDKNYKLKNTGRPRNVKNK